MHAENAKKRNALFVHLAKLSLVVCMAANPARLSAQDSWDVTGLVYLWGASIGGETTTGQSVDVSFSDIVETLDFGLMGSLEARRSGWAVFGDAIYLKISDSGTALVGPGIPASPDIEVQGFVFTGGVGYDFVDNGRTRLNGFGGLRFLNLDTDANISSPGGSRRISGNLDNLDAILGLRGTQELADRWALNYYLDVGAGDSEVTWQAALAFDYRINNRWSVNFGYRHLAWDVDNSAVLSRISFSGPFVGAKYQF